MIQTIITVQNAVLMNIIEMTFLKKMAHVHALQNFMKVILQFVHLVIILGSI